MKDCVFVKAMAEKLSGGSRGKPIRCRAAVCRKPCEPLVIEEIIVTSPMPHEVCVRIIYTSLCHSDLTFWKMKDFPAIFPRILGLGHEAIGVVESVGEDVSEVSEGDTVIPTFMADCGECGDCKSTKSNLCSKLPFKVSPYLLCQDMRQADSQTSTARLYTISYLCLVLLSIQW